MSDQEDLCDFGGRTDLLCYPDWPDHSNLITLPDKGSLNPPIAPVPALPRWARMETASFATEPFTSHMQTSAASLPIHPSFSPTVGFAMLPQDNRAVPQSLVQPEAQSTALHVGLYQQEHQYPKDGIEAFVANDSKLLGGKQFDAMDQIDQIRVKARADEDALREQTAIRDKAQERIEILEASIKHRQDLLDNLCHLSDIRNRPTESEAKAIIPSLQRTGQKVRKKKSKKSLGPNHPDRKQVYQACWKCRDRHKKVQSFLLFIDFLS